MQVNLDGTILVGDRTYSREEFLSEVGTVLSALGVFHPIVPPKAPEIFAIEEATKIRSDYMQNLYTYEQLIAVRDLFKHKYPEALHPLVAWIV